MRRRHALDPATLLIDQHRRVGAANAFAERIRQLTHLIAVGNVALEKDQTPRVFLTQKGSLIVVEREASAAADEGLGHLRLRAGQRKGRRRFAYLAMKHCPPSPLRRAQSAAASAFVKPLTRNR